MSVYFGDIYLLESVSQWHIYVLHQTEASGGEVKEVALEGAVYLALHPLREPLGYSAVICVYGID